MSENKELRETLFREAKNGYDLITAEEVAAIEEYCEGYKKYLSDSRTEREAVNEAIKIAEDAGFVEFKIGMDLKPGTKVYCNNRGKALMLAVIGEESLENGCNIAAAHVDAPRLDMKPMPLYESDEMAFLKTHYYGGIKKYQWVALPLALHGVVILKNGEKVEVKLGHNPDEPQFVITDLLPHLASDQMQKKASEVITGEGLNILIGSTPYAGEGSDRVKLAVMSLLNDAYGIVEEDFLSAELEAVPALEVRDVGLDRSFVGGYGHDDRVCTYAELKAIIELGTPRRTAVCILADKEEIGSEGTSGMQSGAFEWFMSELCDIQGVKLSRCFANSLCVSADVCNAFDPNYPEVSEKRNNAKCNYGMGICKYTGSRGKGGTNDADTETVAVLRKIFADNGVVWQMGELGKVDQGGGDTVAVYMAKRNISTIDAGVPVLSMHAPFEVVAKFDCYMTYKGVKAVYENN
ncbi:MAG: aminopeptidase [Oscillospiraceae bacterium]|nr:aminopeptidase [Oscillospiraceae bacterium]